MGLRTDPTGRPPNWWGKGWLPQKLFIIKFMFGAKYNGIVVAQYF